MLDTLPYPTRSQYRAALERIASLEREVAVDDKLLAERERVLAEIPECPVHGSGCVPHAVEWIIMAKARLGPAALAEMRQIAKESTVGGLFVRDNNPAVGG
jgi:hypothetical protein